ncbi:hypothetical protein Tco_0953395 [Tanacetum coccineum]|uniref:Uncharacterized protein n=1 Tax=Tanacetum coccineum TaxID=301880 RepID=A0ABQ5DZW5_9ASTR
MLVPSSQLATPSFVPSSKPIFHVHRWPIVTLLYDSNYHRTRFRIEPTRPFVCFFYDLVGLWWGYAVKKDLLYRLPQISLYCARSIVNVSPALGAVSIGKAWKNFFISLNSLSASSV